MALLALAISVPLSAIVTGKMPVLLVQVPFFSAVIRIQAEMAVVRLGGPGGGAVGPLAPLCGREGCEEEEEEAVGPQGSHLGNTGLNGRVFALFRILADFKIMLYSSRSACSRPSQDSITGGPDLGLFDLLRRRFVSLRQFHGRSALLQTTMSPWMTR